METARAGLIKSLPTRKTSEIQFLTNSLISVSFKTGTKFGNFSLALSQAVVFLGTAAWAVTSRQKYVAPGFLRRLWLKDSANSIIYCENNSTYPDEA